MNAALDQQGSLVSLDSRAAYAVEQDVIAGVVMQPDRLSQTTLEPRHFTPGPNRDLWACLLALHEEGEVVDLITVAERCEADGKYENFTYLGELVSNYIDGENWSFKASRLLAKSQQRDLWREVERALMTKDEASIVACAEAITARQAAGSKRAVMATVDVAYESMRDEWAEAKTQPKFTWGLPALDRHVKPMQATRVYVAMARPGVGKTALAGAVALANARAGVKVGFISIEMSMEELACRFLCTISGRNSEWVRGDTDVPPADARIIDEAKQELIKLPIVINDATPMTRAQLQAWAGTLVRRHGCGLLIVDYIQLVDANPGERIPRHEYVGKTAKALKTIARQHKIPVLALAQAGRDAEGRRPTMKDLRESGDIEAAADVILALHREEPDDDTPNDVTEVLVLKNRHGPKDMRIKTIYRGECYRFESYEGRYAK